MRDLLGARPRRDRSMGWRGLLGAALCAPVLALAPGAVAQADGTCTTAGAQVQCTFGYTGGAQTWTAPPGIESAVFDVFGAQGGPGASSIGFTGFPIGGGQGGEATATLTVVPGATYQINVGGGGGSGAVTASAPGGSGGFNGGAAGGATVTALLCSAECGSGGGGGGASDVRTAGGGLADRLIVAGGGGGGGGIGGGGGGGGGGYYGGGGGVGGLRSTPGGGGGGGTQIAGGAGGSGDGSCNAGSGDGSMGGVGAGGRGGSANCAGGGTSGGGGGGGSLGAAGGSSYGGAGGGGGSGFGPTGVAFRAGVQVGDGKVVITYTSSLQDSTPPTTTISLSPANPNGQNGWYTSPPNVSIAAADPDDAAGALTTRCVLDPASAPSSFNDLPTTPCAYLGAGASVGQEGNHTIYAASADPAGNAEAPVRSESFKIDTAAPTIAAAPTGQPNAAGWYNGNVVVNFSCADALSGIPAGACPADQTLSSEGNAVSSTAATVADAAGNVSQPSNVVTVAIDKTPPVVSVTGVADGAAYPLGAVPPAGCTTADALSGVATQATLSVSGGNSDGTGTFTATCAGASDNAGNTAHASATYTVGYAFGGFLAPVANPSTVNTGRAGRTYPVKFQLTDASGAPISSLSAVQSITFQSTGCSAFASAPTDALTTTATGGTSLRYDSTANQYVYNWATPATGGCYTLFLTLDSGQVFSANFNLQ